MDAQLSQDEIDRLFRQFGTDSESGGSPASSATPYDFRRPDRIPKEQLRAIHLMHDFFSRNLASSLGAYLRAYVTVSLVSVEQLSFAEFLQYLPAPTCINSIGMRPLDGNSVLELNSSIVFPVLDVMLGGSGNSNVPEDRELTEIEQTIIDGFLRIILHDLQESWAPITAIDFQIEQTETQPQLMQILSPNEAIVAIGFEITMGEHRGMMNFGIPSISVKMLGHRFDQQWSMRRRGGSNQSTGQMRDLVMDAPVQVDAAVGGGRISLRQLLGIDVGDVVTLDVPVSRRADFRINGVRKYVGEPVSSGPRRALLIEKAC